MKRSQIFSLLASILILPLCSARRHGYIGEDEAQPEPPTACQQKTITVTADATPSVLPTPNPNPNPLIPTFANDGRGQQGQDFTSLSSPPQQTPLSNIVFDKITSAILGGYPLPASSSAGLVDTLPVPSSSVELFATTDVLPLTTSTIAAQAQPQYCHHDNCFRELIRYSAVFGLFCQTYTAAGTSLAQIGATPTNCAGPAAKTSSACTCLASLMATASSSSSSSSPAAEPTTTIRSTIRVTSTVVVYATSLTASSLEGSTAQTTPNIFTPQFLELLSTDYESAIATQLLPNWTISRSIPLVTQILTTGTGAGQVTKIPSITPKWTNSSYSTLAPSTKLTVLPSGTFPLANSSSLSATSTRSTGTASAEPTVLRWGTLPASEGIKNCHKNEACIEAADIFETCVNRLPTFENNTAKAECLCDPSNNWKTTTTTCLKCTQEFLPESATPDGIPSSKFSEFAAVMQDAYCNASTQPFSRDLDAFLRVGQNTTALFQSPIYLWNMALLEEAVPEMASYNDTLYVTEESDGWETFPISPRSKKVFDDCLNQSICQRAAANFKLCMTGDGAVDTWTCFCGPTKIFSDTKKALEPGRLDSSFQTLAPQCAGCLAFGLPALRTNGVNADFFADIVALALQGGICDQNSTEEKAKAKDNAVFFGARTTEAFESPVLVFNFTLLEAEIPYVGMRALLDSEENLMRKAVRGT